MSNNVVDLYIARRTMALKSSSSFTSFITTLWKGAVVMCNFNNSTGKIDSVFCINEINDEDKLILEKLIKSFLEAK